MKKKAGTKGAKATVRVKDLEIGKRAGASGAGADPKGGFAPQPEPPKEIRTTPIRDIRTR
jgi:hypothetical protein